MAGAIENGGVPFFEIGYVRVFSGRDGSVLHTLRGERVGAEFGGAMTPVGDWDRDGHEDLAVGAHMSTFVNGFTGVVRVYSGRTGNVLHLFTGRRSSDHFGIALASGQDLDGDGMNDLLIGDLAMAFPNTPGSIWAFSGATRQVIHQVDGTVGTDLLGRWVFFAGDLDGDSVPDFGGTAPRDESNGMRTGSLRLYSGRDGSLLNTIYGGRPGAALGVSGANVGDLNGDGQPEIAVGAPGETTANGVASGLIRVYSSAPLAPLGLGCASSGFLPSLTSPRRAERGQRFDLVHTFSPFAAGVLLASQPASEPTLLPPTLFPGTMCVSYLDMLSANLAAYLRADVRGTASLSLLVPNRTELLGTSLALQSFAFSALGSIEVTNGLVVRVF